MVAALFIGTVFFLVLLVLAVVTGYLSYSMYKANEEFELLYGSVVMAAVSLVLMVAALAIAGATITRLF